MFDFADSSRIFAETTPLMVITLRMKLSVLEVIVRFVRVSEVISLHSTSDRWFVVGRAAAAASTLVFARRVSPLRLAVAVLMRMSCC